MLTAASRKNIVIAMALAGAALLALNRWVLPALFDLRPIRDGVGMYARDDARLRLAVWESPRPLAGELDTAEHESHARVSPDGRWLVYSAGEVGGDCELHLAELVGGVPGPARVLAELGSAADELAPAWGEGALYFCSDRAGGAGGFDLYRAPWDGASFGPVEPLAELNTSAHECEPAPGAQQLVFASDRGGAGFDLYFAQLGGAPARLEPLSSTSDERDPFVTPDGRALYFASNRARGGEDFDLWRSFADRGEWLAPELVAGLDSRAAERAPATSPDGLTLYFSRAGEASAELLVARSIELFRGATPARGWADLWLMAALLLLALVAALSKRWEELDLLYKCALASVIAHLIVLALLRELRPAADAWDKGPSPERRVRVRLESPRERGIVERAGRLERERVARGEATPPQPRRFEVQARDEELRSSAAGPIALEAAPLASAPRAEPAAIERFELDSAPLAPQLELPSEVRARRTALRAAESELRPAPTRVDRDGLPMDAPELARRTPPAVEAAAPTAAALVREAPERDVEQAPSARPTAALERSTRADALAASPRVDLPAETPARRAIDPLEAPLEPVRAFERHSMAGASTASAPSRIEVARAAEEVSSALPAPSAALERSAAPSTAGPIASAFSPAATEHASRSAKVATGPQLALPLETRQRSSLESAPSSPAPQPFALAPQRRAPIDEAGPSGPVASATQPIAPLALQAPAFQPLEAAPRAAVLDTPPAPRPLDDTPYRSRFGSEKEIALREHGGSAETERAVANGLRYLAGRQRRDGSWGSRDDAHPKYRDVRVGKSGLALLAFLGAGHTPGSSGEYARVSDAAVNWLLSTQDAATGHFGDCEAYGHGIATYALAECFALTRDARLGDAVRRAVELILAQQLTRGDARSIGGWSYFYPDGAIFDRWPRASIAAWQVMALESARLGGLDVPELAFERAREFLRGSWDADLRRFRYSHDPQRLRSGYATLPGSTPAALFALSLLGEDLATPRWREAVEFVSACAPRGYRWEGERAFVERAGGNLYFWYYGSLALLRRGGDAWERWNIALKESLPPAQAEDGSWAPLDVYSQYAGDDERDRVYSTAMCVLSLEVYYRYFTPLLEVR